MYELLELIVLLAVVVVIVGVGERYPRVAQWAHRMLNTPPPQAPRPPAPIVPLDLSRERRRQVARRHAGDPR